MSALFINVARGGLVDEAALERVKRAYERVAELVGTFPVMRPGMVASFRKCPRWFI